MSWQWLVLSIKKVSTAIWWCVHNWRKRQSVQRLKRNVWWDETVLSCMMGNVGKDAVYVDCNWNSYFALIEMSVWAKFSNSFCRVVFSVTQNLKLYHVKLGRRPLLKMQWQEVTWPGTGSDMNRNRNRNRNSQRLCPFFKILKYVPELPDSSQNKIEAVLF